MGDFLESFGNNWIEEAGGVPDEPIPAQAVEPEPKEELPPEEPEVESEEVAEQPQSAEPEKPAHTVPYAELRREREKRQEAERKLAESNQLKTPAKDPFEGLDAYERPQEVNQVLRSEIENLRWQASAEISGMRAEIAYGKPLVEEAITWSQKHGASDPTFGLRVQNSSDPVGLVVQEYQRHRTLEAVGGKSFEEAAREYAVKQGWAVSPDGEVAPTTPVQTNKPKPSTPPRSLATQPGQGGSNQSGGDPFEGLFSSDRMGLRK